MEMSLAEFNRAIEVYMKDIEEQREMPADTLLQIGRIWNTLNHYTSLQTTPSGQRFYRLVRDVLMPRMIETLEMKVGRGYSFYSERWEFRLGGIPDAKSRQTIPELEKP
jgi:hypothetical protein